MSEAQSIAGEHLPVSVGLPFGYVVWRYMSPIYILSNFLKFCQHIL